LGSIVITRYAIGYWFSFSDNSVTCDTLSFKTSHPISTIKHVRCDSLQEISFHRTSREITMLWKDFLEFLSWIKTHPTQTSHLILLLQTFVLSSCQYMAAQSVQWLWHKLEDLGFKSCEKQQNYPFSKTSRPVPAPTQPPTAAFSLAVNWPVQTVWPLTYI